MKKGSTLFLRGVIVLIGIATLGICIFALPQVIGDIEFGGYDPILFGLYVTALPFFIALYQAWLLLSYIDKNNAFSELSVMSLKNIKYCAIIISAFYIVGMPYIVYVADKDDAPGVVAIGLVIIFSSIMIATFSALLQKLLKNAIDIKSENDLTV